VNPPSRQGLGICVNACEQTGSPFHQWDESITTEGQSHLHASGVADSSHKKVVDQVAASPILQACLDAKSMQQQREEEKG